ncbi:MAG: hypothetical protein ABI452_00980, partial [Candidatus Limnocylindrales bacterium]
VCLEWLDPPFASGHWVPEQVRRAGGWDLLGAMGQPARETTWMDVRDVEPEQLLLMPCGFDAPRTADEWRRGRATPPDCTIYALNGSAYFSRPGPRVVDGIALLAELFDPGQFRDEVPADGWLPVEVRA